MPRSLLHQLAQLDDTLLALLRANIEDFDDAALQSGLEQRAGLLEQLVKQGEASEQQIQEVIARSKTLATLAEQVKMQLGEQLATIQKGRRSQLAYQNVKYQE